MHHRVPEDQFIELNVPANTALLWRTQVWHCVTPNLSNTVRKVFYVGYHYRWLRPTDYVQQDPELIAHQLTPTRRQLLECARSRRAVTLGGGHSEGNRRGTG